ncbi:MAG: caspase family protein [Opitutales bacterium]|nr:caspase family protein [Opitutales bacterium]
MRRLTGVSDYDPADNHALLIAVDHYKQFPDEEGRSWKPLENAVNDANALKKVLVDDYGFYPEKVEMIGEQEATFERIRRALIEYTSPRAYSTDADPAKMSRVNLLVFFAGHGARDGAWAPVNSRPDRRDLLITPPQIKGEFVEHFPGRHLLIFSDACFSAGLLRADDGDWAQAFGEEERIPASYGRRSRFLFASGDGPVDDVDAQDACHSPFMSCLLSYLRNPGRGCFSTRELAVHFDGSRLGSMPHCEPLTGHHGGGLFHFFYRGKNWERYWKPGKRESDGSKLSPLMTEMESFVEASEGEWEEAALNEAMGRWFRADLMDCVKRAECERILERLRREFFGRYSLKVKTGASGWQLPPVLVQAAAPEGERPDGLAPGSAGAFALQREAAKALGLPVVLKLERSGVVLRLVPPAKDGEGLPFYLSWLPLGAPLVALLRENRQGILESVPPSLPLANDVSPKEIPRLLRRLERMEKLPPKTLSAPVEADWSRACRAGTSELYYTGGEESDMERAGWCAENTLNLARVDPCRKLPNAFGLYGMLGCLWEWCVDTGDSGWIACGGSYRERARDCSHAARDRFPSLKTFSDTGLRLKLQLLKHD